jgi:NAD-dependent SIR2 family protein deacetylase
MTTDRITFSCIDCGEPVRISEANSRDDGTIISCTNCGREFGTFGVVRKAMIAAGKAEIDKMFVKRFGKKPTWQNG